MIGKGRKQVEINLKAVWGLHWSQEWPFWLSNLLKIYISSGKKIASLEEPVENSLMGGGDTCNNMVVWWPKIKKDVKVLKEGAGETCFFYPVLTCRLWALSLYSPLTGTCTFTGVVSVSGVIRSYVDGLTSCKAIRSLLLTMSKENRCGDVAVTMSTDICDEVKHAP